MAAAAADPFTSAFSSFAGNFGKGLADSIGGGSGPFVGGSSAANSFGTTQDGSGWVVNVGGKQDTTQSLQRTANANPNLYDSTPQYVNGAGGPAMAGVSGIAGFALLSIVVVALLRKRKG